MDGTVLALLATATSSATNCVAPAPWLAPTLQFVGTMGAVAVGAYLVSRREDKAHRRKKDADKLFLAVTVSAVLETFTSECAAVADDDGTPPGQRRSDHERSPQVKAPDLSYANLDVVWRALPALLLDQGHALPRKLESARRFLAFMHSYDEEDYFFERRLKYAELGVLAANISEKLRLDVGLPAQIDPTSTTRKWIESSLDTLKATEQMRLAEQAEWVAAFTAKMAANEQESQG